MASPPITTLAPPKSICICRPGGVSNRTVARASAASSRRRCATARSTVRRLMLMPCSARSSCRTTSALPRWRRKRSASQSLQPVEGAWPAGHGQRRPAAALHIALHRVPAAAELGRDPPRPPTQRVQPEHGRDFVRRAHILSPQAIHLRRSLLGHGVLRRPCSTTGQFLMSSPEASQSASSRIARCRSNTSPTTPTR